MKCKNDFCRKTVFSFWGQFSKSKWLLHGQVSQMNSLFAGANAKTGVTEREHQNSLELIWSIFSVSDKRQCDPKKISMPVAFLSQLVSHVTHFK